jgi:hypothetical protein
MTGGRTNVSLQLYCRKVTLSLSLSLSLKISQEINCQLVHAVHPLFHWFYKDNETSLQNGLLGFPISSSILGGYHQTQKSKSG